jgi:hypothetical protein
MINMNTVNINEKTGIPYGVISMQSLDSDLAVELYDAARNSPAAEKQRNEILLDVLEDRVDDALRNTEDPDKAVETLEDVIDQYHNGTLAEWLSEDFLGAPFEYEGLNLMITELGGAHILFVLQSPIVTKAAPCSPCVPNAGDLDNPGGLECYGVPEDWKADHAKE